MLKRLVLIAACSAAMMTIGSCGTPELSADSSCKDFMNADSASRDEAVRKVATEKGAGNAVTPLGRPNVDYMCVNNPSKTLGWAIEKTG